MAHADLMDRFVPGLISQMFGFLMSKKFKHTSFFEDDRSDYDFAYDQESTNADETITTKQACELDLRKHGKEVRHYHAENGARAVTKHEEQNLTFYEVRIHHQNGKSENRIKTICKPARSMLTHATHRWLKVITQELWPHSVC